ncbi:hypothetical protein AXG93_3005s1220 [Marchantia polymorpha subsp. ruderalis]|uniref:BZIP domain-containing protein n=1 Tax=Marchantia polymorpha subsp. ruderalis TaxID=1480154 RepID=A0A176WP12_MARPO|nr:hypothetical protein AXG93_3005s1220 [Marchantia polymorpha subsp. ruderalis]
MQVHVSLGPSALPLVFWHLVVHVKGPVDRNKEPISKGLHVSTHHRLAMSQGKVYPMGRTRKLSPEGRGDRTASFASVARGGVAIVRSSEASALICARRKASVIKVTVFYAVFEKGVVSSSPSMEVTNELPCRELDLSLEDVLELFVDSEEPFDSEPWDFSQSLLPPSPGFFSFDEANGWEIKDRSEICPESGGCESLEATQIIASDEFLVDDGRLGVSSPVSCSGAELGSNLVATSQVETRPYCSNSSEGTSHSELNQGALDLGRSNSNLHCDSFLELKSLSPESGCTSSDEQVQGRSCNNCPTQSGDATASGEDVTGTVDEDTKKRIRLMRNRESATQSRLRKKSYVKELEMRLPAVGVPTLPYCIGPISFGQLGASRVPLPRLASHSVGNQGTKPSKKRRRREATVGPD